MNKQSVSRKITIAVLSIAMVIMSACTRSFGGHSITITMPHNSCAVAGCTTETPTDILIVK